MNCHRSWVSMTQVHCVLCHQNFASDGVAQLHWTKDGHVHPSQHRRFEVHPEAHGPVWRTRRNTRVTPSSKDLSPTNRQQVWEVPEPVQ